MLPTYDCSYVKMKRCAKTKNRSAHITIAESVPQLACGAHRAESIAIDS